VLFQQVTTGGCLSYLIACGDTYAAALIDPELSQIDRYLALVAQPRLQLHYVVDTHTHADHFSGTAEISRLLGVPVVMHQESPVPFVDIRLGDRDRIMLGRLRIQIHHTPGHTRDSMCLRLDDCLFTGDTLLIGGTGRTDLPTGDPEALHDSLFKNLLQLDPSLKVYPAHDYHGRHGSTLAHEIAQNPRLQIRDRRDFVAMMRNLDLPQPSHMRDALRANLAGGTDLHQSDPATVHMSGVCKLRSIAS
jgi:glyoxylase-like metal-dependent hydrolase (beta-lactamase superfamily II)